MPRDKTAEEIAEVARPRRDPVLRAAMQELTHDRAKQGWHDLPAIGASLVNYAAAPVGGQVYDSNWLASNTGAR